MIRFFCLLVLAGGLLAGSRTNAEAQQLEQVWSYLESLPSLAAQFTQKDPDGEVKRGWLALAPPGRARIEYEPPDSTVLVADGQYLIYHNPDAGQTAHFALERLPLRVLFEGRRPTPEDNLKVLFASEQDEFLVVRIAAVDDDGVQVPGWVDLVFSREPFGLSGWRMVDVQQRATVVILEDVQTTVFAESDMFRLSDEMIQRGDLWRGPWTGRTAPPTGRRGRL